MGNILSDCQRCNVAQCDVCTEVVLPLRNRQAGRTRHSPATSGAEAGVAAGQTGGTGGGGGGAGRGASRHGQDFRDTYSETGGDGTPPPGALQGDEDPGLVAAIAASYASGGTGGGGPAGARLTPTEEELLAQAIRRAKNEEESRERARLREEQASEYEESLRIDQQREYEKALRKKEAEEAARQKAEEEEARRLKEEKEASEAAAAEAARKQRAETAATEARAQLVPEPARGEAGRVEVMVKVPDGRRLKRAFLASEPVARLYHFANAEAGEGLAGRSFRLVSSMPRRVYEDKGATLESEGIKGQCALLVEITDED